MIPLMDLERSFHTGGVGIGQTITAAADARRNDVALITGRYAIKGLTGSMFIRAPVGPTGVALATDWVLATGDILPINVNENEMFVSVLQNVAPATAVIVGTDDRTRGYPLTTVAWT